jgi:hypothetical protein
MNLTSSSTRSLKSRTLRSGGETAVRAVHPSVATIAKPDRNVDPLANLVRHDGQSPKQVDKVAIALAVAEQPPDLNVLDLRDRVDELVRFIDVRSREPVIATPVAVDAGGAESESGSSP